MVGSTSMDPLAWGTPRFIRSVNGVAALPISICPQAMSYLRPSSEVDLVSPVMACLVDVYGAEKGRGACAEMEPLLMMRPPRGCWLFMILIASWVHKKGPVRFVSITVFHCSTVRSSSGTGGAPVPGLLKSRSRRPKASFVRAKSALIDAGSVTSVGTTSERAPDALFSVAVASSASLRRPARATAYPSFMRASATALPIPLPAPVTIATLFVEAMQNPPLCSCEQLTYHGPPSLVADVPARDAAIIETAA